MPAAATLPHPSCVRPRGPPPLNRASRGCEHPGPFAQLASWAPLPRAALPLRIGSPGSALRAPRLSSAPSSRRQPRQPDAQQSRPGGQRTERQDGQIDEEARASGGARPICVGGAWRSCGISVRGDSGTSLRLSKVNPSEDKNLPWAMSYGAPQQ